MARQNEFYRNVTEDLTRLVSPAESAFDISLALVFNSKTVR